MISRVNKLLEKEKESKNRFGQMLEKARADLDQANKKFEECKEDRTEHIKELRKELAQYKKAE